MEHESAIGLPRPIPNSYWVDPGRLLAGEYPGATSRSEAMQRIQLLLQAGVTSFLDLTEKDELPAYQKLLARATEQQIRYRRMPITDHSVPDSAQRMSDILDYLSAELAERRCVYVHCRAGIGRTGTTIACHLIRGGLPHQEALDRLQRLWRQCARARNWPTVPETDEQIEFVMRWRDRAAGAAATLDPLARYEGAILGLACADILGTMAATSHFDAATLAARMREMTASASGADTAMTRALAESLLAHKAHDPQDQLQRYLSWSRSTTTPVPPELKKALAVWQWSKKPNSGSHDPKNLDPHSLARTLAVAMLASADVPLAFELAADASRTTQQSPVVLDLCRVWAATFVDALQGTAKSDLGSFGGPAMRILRARQLKPPVRSMLDGAGSAEQDGAEDALSVSQYAMHSFVSTSSLRDAVLQCLTRHRTVPSAAALCGALAGAHYGVEGIAPEWLGKVAEEAPLRSLARHCLQS